jgi:small subunit ribosomal protein S1
VKKKRKNVKAATEILHLIHTNAPAATLGDNNDVLAALKAKMEKQRKNNS